MTWHASNLYIAIVNANLSEGAVVYVAANQQNPPTCCGNLTGLATLALNVDVTPPMITVSANPSSLWPPNHQMVPVTISGTIKDNLSGVDANTAAFTVTDEYGSVQPSGPVSLAIDGSYSFTISLQASREGSDMDGRQYTITVSAKDLAGNLGSAATLVTVPHDQGH